MIHVPSKKCKGGIWGAVVWETGLNGTQLSPPRRARLFNERTVTLSAGEVLWKPKRVISDGQSDTAFRQTSLFRWKQTEVTDWPIISPAGMIPRLFKYKELETNPFSNVPFLMLSFTSSPQNGDPQTLPIAHCTQNVPLCLPLRQRLFRHWGEGGFPEICKDIRKFSKFPCKIFLWEQKWMFLRERNTLLCHWFLQFLRRQMKEISVEPKRIFYKLLYEHL